MFQQMLKSMLSANNPTMQLFNQLLGGQSPRQQIQTLIRQAQANGFDINKKCFSSADIKQLGL